MQKKRIMINGYLGKTTEETIYDYIGCLFPEGIISSEQNLLFNHNQIDKIFYIGYTDDEQKQFKEKLINLENNIKN